MKSWRCIVCGYIHPADEPPDVCPVCGVDRLQFEPYEESSPGPGAVTSPGDNSHPSRIVIVGAGIAGVSAAEAVRTAQPGAMITLISKEKGLPYLRLNLTRYLAGEITADELVLHPATWYSDRQIDLITGVDGTALDLKTHTLTVSDGRQLPYDKLVLTPGAQPFVPPIPGSGMDGVKTLLTIGDADSILESARNGRRCVCIGGGILGLETAGALARRGVDVTVMEVFPWLMPRLLNQRAADILRRHVAGLGIKLILPVNIAGLTGDKHVQGVHLRDGDTIPADIVVVAAGVRPNIPLAKQSGLAVGKGILVDNHLTTSNPDIFAAGDAAEHQGVLYGTWIAAQFQGSIAGRNAAGIQTDFGGIPRSNTLKVLGLDLVSIGVLEPECNTDRVLEDETAGGYLRFVFRGSTLAGAILIGKVADVQKIKHAIESKMNLARLLDVPSDAVNIAAELSASQ